MKAESLHLNCIGVVLFEIHCGDVSVQIIIIIIIVYLVLV